MGGLPICAHKMPSRAPFLSLCRRRGFEQLVRRLLNHPNKPGLVILNHYGYPLVEGEFWSHAEDGYGELMQAANSHSLASCDFISSHARGECLLATATSASSGATLAFLQGSWRSITACRCCPCGAVATMILQTTRRLSTQCIMTESMQMSSATSMLFTTSC
jgi:hypothetical protein